MVVVLPTAALAPDPGLVPCLAVVTVAGQRSADHDDQARASVDDDLVIGGVPVVLVVLGLLGHGVVPCGRQGARVPSTIRTSSLRNRLRGWSSSRGPRRSRPRTPHTKSPRSPLLEQPQAQRLPGPARRPHREERRLLLHLRDAPIATTITPTTARSRPRTMPPSGFVGHRLDRPAVPGDPYASYIVVVARHSPRNHATLAPTVVDAVARAGFQDRD